MSNVRLTIGGRQFTVACAEGEEAHVTELGDMIAARIAAMGEISSQSETRMLLFAALLLADDLHEASARLAQAGAAPPPAPPSPPQPNGDGRRLEAIAERLENLAHRLESGPNRP